MLTNLFSARVLAAGSSVLAHGVQEVLNTDHCRDKLAGNGSYV